MPQVVYFDGQPASFATFVKRLTELQVSDTTVVTNSIADDALRSKLINADALPFPLYFTRRVSFKPEFAEKFKARFKKEPTLSADLGYYAVKLVAKATAKPGNTLQNIQLRLGV